jgi:hypothetical protein
MAPPLHLDPEAQRVKAHWQKYRPKMSALLQQQGKLDHMVLGATNLMRETQADLVGKGQDYNQALEQSRPIAYLPDEEDAPNLPASLQPHTTTA